MKSRILALMQGTLALCGTPIGNLGDVSKRLADTLRTADIVYAEDTRRTSILLGHLGISTPLRSMFVGNEKLRAEEIRKRLSLGEFVVVVTDAGMPVVSDPGASAVVAAEAAGAIVTVIPGPSAVSAALAASGFTGDRFVFEGFLPRKGRERTTRIAGIATDERTVVLFASPKRLAKDLGDLAAVLGDDRRVVVAREITKIYEEFWRGDLGSARDHWLAANVKGECTIVIEGRSPQPPSLDEALDVVATMMDGGVRFAEAVREASAVTGVRRNDVYDAAIDRRDR